MAAALTAADYSVVLAHCRVYVRAAATSRPLHGEPGSTAFAQLILRMDAQRVAPLRLQLAPRDPSEQERPFRIRPCLYHRAIGPWRGAVAADGSSASSVRFRLPGSSFIGASRVASLNCPYVSIIDHQDQWLMCVVSERPLACIMQGHMPACNVPAPCVSVTFLETHL